MRVDRNDLPWWELVRIENTGDGKSVLIVRVDHAIGDGIALVSIMENIATNVDGTALSNLVPINLENKFKRKLGICENVSMVCKGVVAVGKVLGLAHSKYDDDTAFSWNVNKDLVYNNQRRHILFPDIPLPFIKELKNAHGDGTTVNDVMMTIVSQTIHNYCKSRNDPLFNNTTETKKLQCRALMPIALPRSSQHKYNKTKALSNKFVFLSTNLGIGISQPTECLQHIRQLTYDLKNSPIAHVQYFLQSNIVPLLPISLARQTVYDTFTRHSLVLTNVPGPSQPTSIAGQEIQGIRLFFNNLIPNFGILSYCDVVYCSMSCDGDVIEDCDLLMDCFKNSVVGLSRELNVNVPSCLL